jgi:hypothetical protein
MNPSEQYQQMPMQHQIMNQGNKLSPATMYGTQQGYPDAHASYQHVQYDTSQQPGGMPYGAVPPGSMMEQQYAGQNVFPTPPMQQPPPTVQQQPSPEAYSPGDYQHHDLADLLGTLKVNETGTG